MDEKDVESKPLLHGISSDSEPEADAVPSCSQSDSCDSASLPETQVRTTINRAQVIHSTTNNQSLMNLIKGMVGTGILAVPQALYNAGLWVGFVGLIIMAIISTHCMHQLVVTSQRLCHRLDLLSLDYGGVVENAFNTGPVKFRKFSKAAVITINVSICITQFGFCIVYILFIADNVRQVVQAGTSSTIDPSGFVMPIEAYQACVFGLLLPFIFIKNLRTLAPLSMFANFLILFGIVIILQYSFQNLQPIDFFPAFNSWSTLALYFGTAIFAFEGIGVVLPIENKMREPEAFGGLTGVLNTAMVIVTVLYISVGFYGYLMAGINVKSSITLNLPTDNWFYLSVKLIFAISIFMTYLIQFYVPVEILWPKIEPVFRTERFKMAGHYLVRGLFLFGTFLVAVAIPHLELMISLIGASAASLISLIFPPLLELLVFHENIKTVSIIKNVAIIIFGFIGLVAGTGVSLMEIINTF